MPRTGKTAVEEQKFTCGPQLKNETRIVSGTVN